MKGNTISEHRSHVIVADFHNKFPGLVCNEVINATQATRVIEATYFNCELHATAHVYVRFTDPREYFFIKQNLSINALINFVDNKFPLTDCVLRPDLEGKYYSELGRPDQRRINEQVIVISIVYGQDEAGTIKFFEEMLG